MPVAVACEEIGVLTGLRLDRREVGFPGEFERMSAAELQAVIAAETTRLIELPGDTSAQQPHYRACGRQREPIRRAATGRSYCVAGLEPDWLTPECPGPPRRASSS
jgi:hypothetical protein